MHADILSEFTSLKFLQMILCLNTSVLLLEKKKQRFVKSKFIPQNTYYI